ncbi:hypothetical protein Tco_1064828 [Tanacetum coccineum]
MSSKKPKIGEAFISGEEQSTEKEKELSKEELPKLLVIVPVEELVIQPLQVRYPIIDWEVYSEDTRRGHDIFMLVEKEYPLTRGTLRLMMVGLEISKADSEMPKNIFKTYLLSANTNQYQQIRRIHQLDTTYQPFHSEQRIDFYSLNGVSVLPNNTAYSV